MKALSCCVCVSVLFLCATGCENGQRHTAGNGPAGASDLFLTIERYGPQSKPVKEVAFASAKWEGRLKEWVAVDAETGARKGVIVSDLECAHLDSIVQQSPFKDRQSVTQPTWGPIEAQYVIFVHSSRGDVYIPLGYDRVTQSMLGQIRESLDATNRVLLDPIMSFASRSW